MRPRPRLWHLTRAECVLVAVLWGVLAAFAGAYNPTKPTEYYLTAGALGVTALLAALALVPPVRRALGRPWARWGLVPLVAVAGLGAAGLFAGTSFLVLHMVLPPLARFGAVLTLVGLMIVAALGWRGRVRVQTARVIFFVTTFCAAFVYVPICMWLWAPPAELECRQPATSPHVTRLTPQSWAAGLSYPYEVTYLPDRQLVVASFKMAGNTVLDFWDKSEANKLAVFDVSDPAEPVRATLPLPGEGLPEHLAWDPTRSEIAVERIGFDERSVVFVDVTGFPRLKVSRELELDFEPHAIHIPPSGESLGVFSVDLQHVTFDLETLAETSRARIEMPVPMVMLLNITRRADQPIFLSTFGQAVVRYEPGEDHEPGYAFVPFAGGDITVHPSGEQVYQTDLMFWGLDRIGAEEMEMEQRVLLDYAPRPVAVDAARDLLMVGGWFDGVIRFYRASTLEQLEPQVPVGKYLRKLAWDPERGLLWAASKCGVHQVRVDEVLGGG